MALGLVEAVVFSALGVIALHRQKIGEGALVQLHIGVHVIQLAIGELTVDDESQVRRGHQLHRSQRQRGHDVHEFAGFAQHGLRKARGHLGHGHMVHDGGYDLSVNVTQFSTVSLLLQICPGVRAKLHYFGYRVRHIGIGFENTNV